MTKMSKSQYNSYVTYRDYLNNQIYTSPPVDIIKFLSDPYYLGQSFNNGQSLFNCWKPVLRDIYGSDEKYLAVYTGSTGTGKTEIAYAGVAYTMYRALLLKNVWQMYGLSDGGRLAIAFFNLTKTLSQSKGFNVLQHLLLKSPWFKKHGTVKGEDKNERIEFKLFDYLLSSPEASGYGVTGHHVFCAVLDEVDSPNATIKTKEKVIAAFDTTLLRFKGRFVKHNKSLGRFFLVSSRQDELSFLNMYIHKMKENQELYVADFKKWDAIPQDNFCGLRFKVSCGDGFNPPKIMSKVIEHKECTEPLKRYEISDIPELIQEAKEKGFEHLDVPVEYYQDFKLDLAKSIRDLGGITVAGMRKSKLFPSEDIIQECYDEMRDNPITVPVIDMGLRDTWELMEFLDISKMVVNRSIPRHIHCDIAYSGEGDRLGLSMACLYGQKTVKRRDPKTQQEKEYKLPIAHTDFTMGIKARPGDVIPFYKLENFIVALRDAGFRIADVTFDLRLASQGLIQQLKLKGFKADNFSMDKPVDNFIMFRNIVFEKRWNCFFMPLLNLELKELIYDQTLQKVDHPMLFENLEELEDGDLKSVVLKGSKDLADATAGAAIRAIMSAGEVMDTDLMKNILQTLDVVQEQQTDFDKTVSQILPTVIDKDGKQQKVIGTAGSDGIMKFKDLLKGLG